MTDKIQETDHLYYLTAKMCRSPKWFETAEDASVDYLWSKSLGDIIKNPKPIPPYARDEHTSFGARVKMMGRPIDNRFSGHDYGRRQTKFMYDYYGRLSPDNHLPQDFYAYWEQYKELFGEEDEQPLTQEITLPL